MKLENLEDIYEISPVQQGLLFHSLYAPSSGIFIAQVRCLIEGELNIPAFQQAWQQAIDQYSILRTSFHWAEMEKPLQVVQKQVHLRLQQDDWRALSCTEQQQRMLLFEQQDRETDFQMTEAPLMRLTLIRLKDTSYQFIWTFHHSILDGWSVAVLLKEVVKAYEAGCHEQKAFFPPGRPYRDYIQWLQDQEQDNQKVAAFWQQALQGASTTTFLRGKNNGKLPHQTRGIPELQQIRLSRETTSALQAIARTHQLTLSTLVQGTWALVLSRYSNTTDLLFGSTSSGRPASLEGIEQMVGLFINTLPTRVRIDSAQFLLPWLKELQGQQVEIRQYEYSSLVQIRQWAGMPGDQALFESIIVFENYPLDEAFGAGNVSLRLSNFHWQNQSAYPLTIVVIPGTELLLQASYTTASCTNHQVLSLLQYMQLLLESIAASPHQRLSDFPPLLHSEWQQISMEWNAPSLPVSALPCIQTVFEQQVSRRPDALAIAFQEQSISYEELNRRANQLAHALHKAGVGPEVLVGLCLERSIEMVIGILGILKAGGAYVPLDPSYPLERLHFMREDAALQFLITREDIQQGIPLHLVKHIFLLDRDWPQIGQESPRNPAVSLSSNNLAYIIYTSGSTGKPKGVLVPHGGVCNLVQSTIEQFHIHDESHVLQYASLNFDASVWQIFMALHAGATLFLVNQATSLSTAALVTFLNEAAITVTDTPTLLLDLLPAHQIITLETLSTGGDRCTLERARTWSQGRRFFNVYGPTETTVVTTWQQVTGVTDEEDTIPIGHAIPNVHTSILDPHLQPLPVGVAGELFIGGIGVTRGYLHQPELTAERFLPDPFSRTPGARCYRTGDVACYRPDGTIEFLGRTDHQVKIRGFRVEPGEIETHLKHHPAIQEALVDVREAAPGEKRLIAYVVLKPHQSLSAQDLRAFLEKQVPIYMIPSVFQFLQSFPIVLNGSGKIDRQALPLPDWSRIERSSIYRAPKTEVEKTLVRFWSEVLRVEQVGIEDNFFELGGHSLTAMQLLSRIDEHFHIELPLHLLFDALTVSRQAQLIARAIEEEDVFSNMELSQNVEELLEDLEQASDELLDIVLLTLPADDQGHE